MDLKIVVDTPQQAQQHYDDADLYDEEMFCIISTGIEWIMTKVILKSNSNGGNVEECNKDVINKRNYEKRIPS
ncbi:unnamed protein product [Rhizophagus irregularis]|nr:unnamed protein product [Rhizophagus irregularis]